MTKKEQIVEKAIELFGHESFESVSIQRLAEATGVAQGLLYRHFKNKNDLLLHLLHLGMEQVQQTLLPYQDPALDLTEAFTQHIRLSFRYIKKHQQLWNVLHHARQNPGLMKTLQLTTDPRKLVVKPIKDKLKAAGIADAEMHAWFIFSLIDGITSLYLVHPEIYPLRNMEKFLTQKIIDYVSANS